MLFRSNDTATTEIYTLSLHDALPICFANGLTWAAVLLTSGLSKILKNSTSFMLILLFGRLGRCNVSLARSVLTTAIHTATEIPLVRIRLPVNLIPRRTGIDRVRS